MKKKQEKKGIRIFSRILTVMIIFLTMLCLVLFFKTVTKSDVNIFGMRFYYIKTESMYPTIKPDSLVFVKNTDPEALKEGDVISFVSRDPAIRGCINTHRIIGRTMEDGEEVFITMGDNNPAADSYYVRKGDIVGKVIAHTVPLRGLANFFEFAGTPTGFLVIIIFPLSFALLLIIKSFLTTWKENELLQQEKTLEEKKKKQKEAAIRILEQYFGKKLKEITEEDVERVLAGPIPETHPESVMDYDTGKKEGNIAGKAEEPTE